MVLETFLVSQRANAPYKSEPDPVQVFQLPLVASNPWRTVDNVLTQLVRAGSPLADASTVSPLRSGQKGKLIH